MDPEAEADAYRTAAVIDAVAEEPALPVVQTVNDDEALAAAYAAMGALPFTDAIEFQGELGSSSAKAMAAPLPRASASAGEIQLLEVQA